MKKIRFQCFYNDMLYASYHNKIIRKHLNDKKWSTYLVLSDLPEFSKIELYNRLFREGIHNFNKINDKVDIIVLKGKIQFFIDGKLVNTLRIENGSRPLRNGIVYKDNYIIYSEYHGNSSRNPINVYKYDFYNNSKVILYTFNNIRHIHFIQEDILNTGSIYIGTGDLDNECAIYKLDILNESIEKVGGGSQTWRAVSILQKDDSLFWGTDDPDGEDFIIQYNYSNKIIKKIRKIDGPAYYSTMNNKNEMYIATTIENRNVHKAKIYKSLDGEKWDEVMEFKKDIYHVKYFGYGLIEFIINQDKLSSLFFNLVGLK